MRRLWRDEKTTFTGRYYQVTDSPRVAPEPVSPTLLVGGGGPHTMRLAGRVADIVSFLPRQATGEWSVAASLADSTLEHAKAQQDGDRSYVRDQQVEESRAPDLGDAMVCRHQEE